MNVSVELKIIIHQPVPAIGYMSAVTTYFSALNINFSSVTMDLRSLSTMNSNWPRDGFISFTACLSTLKQNLRCILHAFTALQTTVKQRNNVKDANSFILHILLKHQAYIGCCFSPVRKNFFPSWGKMFG